MKLSKNEIKKLNALQHKPISRRDWFSALGKGAIGLSSLPFLSQTALSKENPATYPAMIVLDLAGGAGLAGNFSVGKKGGATDFIESYSRLGWDPKKSSLELGYGAPIAPKEISQFFAGFLLTTSENTRKNTRFATICHFGQDDTQSNAHSMHSEVMKFLQSEGIQKQGLGMSSATSGGNSQSVTKSQLLAPAQIKSIEEYSKVVQCFEFNRRGFLDKGVKDFVGKFSDLSQFQLSKWMSHDPSTTDLQKKLQQHYWDLKNMDPNFITDPRKDPIAQKAFQITASTLSNSLEAVTSTISYHTIQGNVGPSTIMLGGFDYHDGTQTTGDQADLKAGKTLGSLLEYASLLNRKVMVQIITDGSVYSDVGTRVWRGDAGDKSLSILVFFDPNGPVTLRKTQLGAFTDGQSVDTDFWFSKNLNAVGRISFLNYLAFSGKTDLISKIYSENEHPASQLKESILL